MKTTQYQFINNTWNTVGSNSEVNPHLLMVFGRRQSIQETEAIDQLREKFPDALMIGCSTSGEILEARVFDDSITATAIEFKNSQAVGHSLVIDRVEDSYEAGRKVVTLFNHNNLKHLFVLTDGLTVNGSEFVRGMQQELPEGVAVTGGMAGDGADFKETLVFTHDVKPGSNIIAAIGLYGDGLKVGYACMGGWDSFGIERLVTRSDNNVLYELDGEPALDLYKSFLGDQAADLPASGLFFPLSIRINSDERPIVRTILAINEAEKSLTFAGNVPKGSYVRLMKANVDRLIDGSAEAAENSMDGWDGMQPELAILTSCVGRKLVLKQLVEEEVEAARDKFGKSTAITGFYSYGEISPHMKSSKCELHNQTMAVTLLSEN